MASDVPEQRADRQDEDTGVERIVDPEDYAKRRGLTRLHDARDRVREMKDEAFRLEKTERTIQPEDRDQFVAETLADYVAELRVVLERRDDDSDEEFLAETVEAVQDDVDEVAVGTIHEQRGLVETERGRQPIHYQTAMRAWDICNSYFEEIAGATFETEGLPKDTGFQSVDTDEEGDAS